MLDWGGEQGGKGGVISNLHPHLEGNIETRSNCCD